MTTSEWQSAIEWLLSQVFAPLIIGAVLGSVVRPATKMVLVSLLVGGVILLGLAALDAISLDKLTTSASSQPIMPSISRLFSVAWDAAMRFPALTVGAGIGYLLGEYWRRRQPAAR